MRPSLRGSRGRRTWPQRLLLSFNIVLVLVALCAAAVLGYGYEKAGSFPRVRLSGVLAEVESSSATAINVLLVGTDSADGLDPDDPILAGRPPANDLADVIMVLRLDPATNDAALLSIPRDLWVPIAGTDQSGKINTAYSVGGAEALVDTVAQYFGIPINHFVAVDFAGFRKVVAAIGDVEVYFPYPARDLGSGLNVPEAGCQRLDSVQSLAFSRSRHYENYIDGRWRRDNLDDWGRMQRQQEFMRRALSRAIEQGARNPVTLNALLNAVDDAVLLDDTLTTGQVLDIANAFRLFNPESLGSYTLQEHVSDRMVRGQAALLLREADADPLLDLFRGDVPLEPTPQTVSLRVLNGSGESDQARVVASSLQEVGFTIRSRDNLSGDPIARTEIRYLSGQRAAAEMLARYLVVSPHLVEDPTLGFSPVHLVIGQDYRGLIEPSSGSRSTASTVTTTPTTPPPTTTTTSTTSTSTTTTVAAGDEDDDDETVEQDAPPPRRC